MSSHLTPLINIKRRFSLRLQTPKKLERMTQKNWREIQEKILKALREIPQNLREN